MPSGEQEIWTALLGPFIDIWTGIAQGVIGLGSRLHPLYILFFLLIALALYAIRRNDRPAQGFFGWLFPKSVYLTRSSLVDLQLFLLGRALAGLQVFTALATPTGFAVLTIAGLSALTGRPFESAPASPYQMAVAGFIVVIAMDFCVYWVHRIHHEFPIFWPFHAVHHSAETLTPLTVYRKHPIYDLFANTARGALAGITQGSLLFFFVGEYAPLTIAGANAAYVLFNIVGANFRHSHIWIGYGPILSLFLISPAQHQIHHSRAPEHHDRNYGEIFAIWDWMFGSLYLPKEQEKLQFGLSDPQGAPLEQPHGTFLAALVRPFADSLDALRAARQGNEITVPKRQDPPA